MSTAPRPRLLILATLVVITSLGSAFLLGRTLSTPRPHLAQSGANSGIAPTGAPVTGGSTSTSPTAPAAAVPASPTIEPSANPLPDPDADRPQLPADPNGPFGSRETTGSTEVALTFDDGPDPQYTPQTLALLRHYKVKATFCVIGENARDYPDLIRAIAADGHTLCNHSWGHDLALGSRSQSAILTDLIRTNQAIQAAVPGAPDQLLPPAGRKLDTNRSRRGPPARHDLPALGGRPTGLGAAHRRQDHRDGDRQHLRRCHRADARWRRQSTGHRQCVVLDPAESHPSASNSPRCRPEFDARHRHQPRRRHQPRLRRRPGPQLRGDGG